MYYALTYFIIGFIVGLGHSYYGEYNQGRDAEGVIIIFIWPIYFLGVVLLLPMKYISDLSYEKKLQIDKERMRKSWERINSNETSIKQFERKTTNENS